MIVWILAHVILASSSMLISSHIWRNLVIFLSVICMGACAIYMHVSTAFLVTHIEIYNLCWCTLCIPILDHSALVIGREEHRKGYGSS